MSTDTPPTQISGCDVVAANSTTVGEPGHTRFPDGWGVPTPGLGNEQYVALKTFRSDGSPVVTPIWVAPAGDQLYAYTPVRSWKVRRVRRDPRVELAPCTFDGRPTGRWRGGRARVLPAATLPAVRRALTAKYGNAFRWFTIVTLVGRLRRHGGRAAGLAIAVYGADPDGATGFTA